MLVTETGGHPGDSLITMWPPDTLDLSRLSHYALPRSKAEIHSCLSFPASLAARLDPCDQASTNQVQPTIFT